MKPKDYIIKFEIQKGWNKSKQKEFLNDLTSELLAQLEYCKAENNIKGFDNAFKVIRMKWDSISNKIPFGLPESMWKYFFATVVAPAREQLCPGAMQKRREEAAARRAEHERLKAWKRYREEEYRRLEEEARRSFFENLALSLLLTEVCPISSFEFLGLSVHCSEEDVMKAYKEKVLVMHPDRGGKQEEFVNLIEHKNKCLKWIKSK